MKKILLVDDDPISAFITVGVLEETFASNVEIEIVKNGMEAMKFINRCLLEQNCMDYIILDLKMPVMDGYELLKALEILQETWTFKIIILSSSAALTDVELAMDQNVIGYICKPITQMKLLQVINTTEV